jgi:ferritin-like metal-binding protein YciE
MSKFNSLNDLFVDEIADLLSAEKQLIKALPKVAEATTDRQLSAGILAHLEQTKGHVERLNQVFEIIGQKPQSNTCEAMKGLIEETDELIGHGGEPSVMDAGIIACAQRVEHYEIAAYGCVRTYANLLGYTEAEQLLQQTLNEEAETDRKLTSMSGQINAGALSAAGSR